MIRVYTLVQLTEWQVMYENNQKVAEDREVETAYLLAAGSQDAFVRLRIIDARSSVIEKLAEAGLLPATLTELTMNYDLAGCRQIPRGGLCPIE